MATSDSNPFDDPLSFKDVDLMDGPAATANFLGAEFDERPKALSDQPMPASPTRANGNGAAPSTSSPYRRSHDDSDRSFVSNAWSGTGNAFASPAPLIVLDEGEQTAADATESDAGSEEAGPSRGSLLAVGLDAGPSTSLGGAGAGAADFGAAAGPSASISVHSPKQVSVASSIPLEQSYTSYTVSLTRRQPGAAAPQVTHVERRFRDIVSLHELLGLTLPGYILPSRPSRNVIEGKLRQSEAFVEERRGGMQAYLNELLSHPVLGTSEPLYVFLNEPTSDLRSSRGWQALQPRGATLLDGAARLAKQAVGAAPTAPSPQELSLPPRVTGNMRRLWRERVVEAAGGLQRAEVGDDERRLVVEGERMECLRLALVRASEASERLVGSLLECAAAAAGLSDALIGWGQYELSALLPPGGGAAAAAALGQLAKEAAGGVARAGKLSALQAGQTARRLQPLQDTLGVMPNVLAALACRRRALVSRVTLEDDLAARRAALSGLEAKGAAVPKAKRDAVTADCAALGVALEAARAEHGRITERNSSELIMFSARRAGMLREGMQELALVCSIAETQRRGLWEEAAGTLGKMARAMTASSDAMVLLPPGCHARLPDRV